MAGSTQNITLFDYLFGLRYSHRSSHRFTPYVEGLAGGSNEISNYAFVQNSSGFAALGGVGVNHSISRLLAWNVVEADYIYSRIANASNNRQSDLRVKTGIYFRFGPR